MPVLDAFRGSSVSLKCAILMGMPKHTPRIRLWNPLLALGLAVCLWVAMDIPTVHAQATNTVGSIQDNITWGMALILQLMQVLTWVVFGFLNYLLDPRFFLGLGDDGAGNATSSLLDMLNNIWVLSRDLMNVIFAVALVFTALYTVITAKKDFVSQNAKRFVMAVVLVNFSWFVPQVLLDISSVATATIYGIPSLLDMDDCTTADGEQCVIITDVKFFNDDRTAASLRGSDGWSCQLANLVCYRKQEMASGTVSSQTAMLSGLVVNHARLINLAKVSRPIQATGAKASRELLVFFIREALILVITIALLFPLLALAVAFFIRIPVLWVTMAFMPFALLDWVVPNEQITQGIPSKIRDTFIKAAFLPAFTAVPLTVGFILINAGAVMDGGGLEEIPFPIIDGIDNFWQLLWLLISLSVLYSGVFSVLKKQDGILATGAASIENFGKGLGKLALSVPLSKEVLPLVTGGAVQQSPLPALTALNPNRLLQNLRVSGSLGDALRGGTASPTRAIDQTDGLLRNNRAELERLNTAVRNLEGANDANFAASVNSLRTTLQSINPQLNIADNRSLAAALQSLNRRNGEVRAPNAVIDRLNRPETPPAPPGPPPPPPGP